MTVTWQMAAIICPLVFLAGFVDSIAGGGGLISLPAYFLIGLPSHMATGTNKLSACLGTAASSWRYFVGGKMVLRVGIAAAVMALPGSWLGTSVQLLIPARAVQIMMICVIPIIAVMVMRRRPERELVCRVPEQGVLPASMAIGFGIGFYDGLVGPGTGTFLILLFTSVLGMEAVASSATAKIVNLASNVAALVTYLITDSSNVLLILGLPAAVCAIAGNLLGANMTMKKGAGFVRKMMLCVLVLLLAKMVYDVVSGPVTM